MIIPITKEHEIESTNKLAMIEFSANWCSPCKKIAPKILELSNKYNNINFYSINIDDSSSSELVDKYNISAVPTFIYIFNKDLKGDVCGANIREIRLILEKLTKKYLL